ncbi:MAG TPA: nitroreductase family protein [Bacteroidales bacterium]|nr:nitroreductase family protein [Bacteroidales bacterium]HPT22250.1 nitroreductase family protein [Bacteroidales bacterium]
MFEGTKLLELIKFRQSDRKYSDKPVEKEKLDRIIEAGRMSPSACNAQPWKFIVITEPGILAATAKAASAKLLGMNSFLDQATAMIVVVREKPNFSSMVGASLKRKDYSLIDIGIATENICLQARAEGIGSCIVGWFDEKLLKKQLGIPKSKRVELIITLGYSVAEHREKKRKPAEETVSYNKY